MRKLLIIVLAVFFLGACGNSNNSSNSDSKGPSDATIRAAAKDVVFVNVVHEKMPQSATMNDQELIGFGHRVCNDFDNLGIDTRPELISYATGFSQDSSEFTPQQGGEFIGASIAAYCPEYGALIN